MLTQIEEFFKETRRIADTLNYGDIRKLSLELEALRTNKGRLFVIGLGGSAANASHAVNDFRKLCNIEAYCPTDNVAELTAWTNDKGWNYALNIWAWPNDALLVLSVGGGTKEVSTPLVTAIDFMKATGHKVFGIVARDGGHTYQHGDCVVLLPTFDTLQAESFQSAVLHCLVKTLQQEPTKWESQST